MLIVIDESGDPGFKFATGSSEYFVCLATLFPKAADAEACDRVIDELRLGLKFVPGYEFHFAECSNKVRRAFFQAICQQNFNFYGFVLNKRALFGKQFESREGFYEFTIGLICENIRPFLRDSKIIIDRCGGKQFKRNLEKALKMRAASNDSRCLIKRVSMEDSQANNLVQLADMVCGAVSRSYSSDREDRSEYRDILKRREGRIDFWPK